MTVNHDVAGSNPASGASGLFVKRLRHRPFTAGSGVRIPHRSPWAISSAGRASALQAECQQFDPVIAHHNEKFHVLRAVGFFIAFFLFSLQSYNLLHPRLTTFCASLCSFKMCSLRNQFDPVIAHQKKASRDPLRGAFFLPFAFFLYGHITSCIRDSRSFARRFAPSNDVRCGTSSILLSPTIMKSSTCSAPWDFLLPFSFFLYSHITSCIRDSLHFAPRFAPSKCVRCGTSSILFSPTIMKSYTCSAPWDFLLPFPFSLICHSPPALKKSIASHPPKGYNT